MTNDEAVKLLDEAEDLLRTAWHAMLKMGLRDRGSDIGLSHEVRMFALKFSEDGRDGPGELQIRGTGDLMAWLRAVRAARNAGVQVHAAGLLVTVCEMRDGDGLTHCAMLHHQDQRPMDGMCVERRADRSEVEAEAAEWREFLTSGVPACHPHEFTDLSEFHADAAAGVTGPDHQTKR